MQKKAVISQRFGISQFFFICLFAIGLGNLLITPPYQVPDEFGHFYRILQLSEGHLIGTRIENSSGGLIPSGFIVPNKPFQEMLFRPEVKLSFRELTRLISTAPASNSSSERTFMDFKNTVLYSPIAYLPQVFGVAIGKQFKVNAYYCFYLGRLFALLFTSYLIFLSIRKLSWSRRYQMIFFSVATLPMFIFESASNSSDAMTNALSLFTIALCIDLWRKWEDSQFIKLLVVVSGLSLCKLIYGILGLAALPAILKDKKPANIIFLFLAVTLPALGWSLLIKGIYVPLPIPGVTPDPSAQVHFVLTHPFSSLSIFFHTLGRDFIPLLECCIGKLGWLDTPLLNWIRSSFVCILILASIVTQSSQSDVNSLGIKVRTYFSTLVLAAICLMTLAIYASVNTPGANEVAGIQGRYFLPIVPLFLITIPPVIKLDERRYKIFRRSLVFCIIILSIKTLILVKKRYWLS